MGAAIAGISPTSCATVRPPRHHPHRSPWKKPPQAKASMIRLFGNRIVEAGFARMVKACPSNLFAPDIAERIQLGNLEDDLDAAATSDRMIEVIVEQLAE